MWDMGSAARCMRTPVPNFGRPDQGRTAEGMTIAIEPMVMPGDIVLVGPDKWTVITKDGSYSFI